MLGEVLDQAPPLLGQKHPYYPLILRIPFPENQALPLKPLGQACYARRVNLKLLTQLSLAYPILLREQRQREPCPSAHTHLSLESALHPPKSEAKRSQQGTNILSCSPRRVGKLYYLLFSH